MNAVVVHGKHDVRFEKRDIQKPGSGEVLIKVKAAGLCGTDADILSGELIYLKNGMAHFPLIPGHEWSGEIVELGANVKGFDIGDYVTGECTVSCGHCDQCQRGYFNMCTERTETGVMNRDGGYAEYITYPITGLHKCNGLTFDQGACVEPTCVAMSAILAAKITPRDNVLIIGPGPIGLMAAQICKKIFAANKVLLSGTRDERLLRAKNYGLDGLINVRKENLTERVLELTGNKKIDVIIEAAGSPTTFEDAEKILNPAGRISLLSFFGSKKSHCNWDFISTNNITIYGSLGSPGVWSFVIDKMESGALEVESIISHRLPLKSIDDFNFAFKTMENRLTNVCKIIFHP